MTQHEIADLVGCSVVLIRKIEADERRPSAQIAERLALALRIAVSDVPAFIGAARAKQPADRLPPPELNQPPVHAMSSGARGVLLPAPLDMLIGREEVLERLLALLHDDRIRLVTLIGPPGIGKTRLALAAAHRLVRNGLSHAWFIDLAPIHDPSLLLPTIAQTVGLRESGQSLTDTVLAFLRQRQALLVLDNLEQIVTAAPQIVALLAGAPQLTVLATSRTALRVSAEHRFSVPPLAIPSAVDLFYARARAISATFAPDESDIAAIPAIVQQLDGMPLAIELAAARVRLFNPAMMLRQLERRLPFLTGGQRDAPARQQTLHHAIGWSYALLDPEEHRLFCWLGVFAGGFTLEAAVTIAPINDSSNRFMIVVDRVGALFDHSLLTRDGARFIMLETLREFALDRLTETAELSSARRAHAEYMLALAERAEAAEHTPQERERFDALEAERANLRAALEWSCEDAAHPDIGVRLGRALAAFWQRRGSQREGCAWLKRISTRSGQTPHLRGRFLGRIMWLTDIDDELDWAERCSTEGLALFVTLGDPLGVALLTGNLGNIAQRRQQYDRALELFRKCEAIYRSGGAAYHLAMVTFWIGETLFLQRDFANAQRALEESLGYGRIIGSPLIITRRLAILGILHLEIGQPAAAADLLCESLAIAQTLDNRIELAVLFTGYAGLLSANGITHPAARLLGASDQLLELIGVRYDAERERAYHTCRTTVQHMLGDTAFVSEWNAGRSLTVAAAMRLACANCPASHHLAANCPFRRSSTETR